MRTSALFGAKTFEFFENLWNLFYGASARTRGEEFVQCGHFSDKRGRGINFLRFCADVFKDGPFAIASFLSVLNGNYPENFRFCCFA